MLSCRPHRGPHWACICSVNAMPGKQELIHFLERKVFNPILQAKADDYSGDDRERLEHVQKSTESEKERYHHYGNAEEVVLNFKRDLHSEAAKKINAELSRLKLPRLPDIKDEFLDFAAK
jgi:hypothetical protein